jgi:uncharacterized protein
MPSTAEKHGSLLTRRQFLEGSAIAVSAGLALYSGMIERHNLTIEHRTVRIANLPPAFHGFRIAQLSDFHYHSYDESWFVRHAVDEVNKLQPDMVALTGDFITAHRIGGTPQTSFRDAMECTEILRGIKCPLRFSTLGNHDAVITDGVRHALTVHGLNPLNNLYMPIDIKGDRLWVAGLADAYFDIPDLPRALPHRKANEPVVLLGHEPDFVDTVAQYGVVDLMLAGHTHGGQIRLPGLPAILLPALGTKYVEGLYRAPKGAQIYVNRGLGCMHLPFRLFCPPELAVITLQPA